MEYDTFVRDRLPPPELLPEFRFDLPELQYPERLNAAAELLKGGAPDALAVVNDHGRWTYAELDDFSGRIARLLVEEHGLIPGNRVLLRGPNGYTMFAAWLGVLKAGGVVVATMPLLRPGEIATVIERAQISHAIVDSRFIGDFRQAVEQTHFVKHVVKYDGDYGQGELETRSASLQPLPPADTGRDDPCIIAFTSGTTGVPKGCVQFHRDVLAPCDTFAKHLVGPKPGDVFLTSAPMAFTFGLGITPMFPLRFGAASATIEQGGPEKLLEAIVEARRHPPRHRADRLQGDAVAAGAGRGAEDPPLLHLRRRASARGDLARVEGAHRDRDHRRHRLDRDDAHLRLRRGRRHPPRRNRQGGARIQATVLDADGNPLDEGVGRLAIKGPTGCRYLDDPRQRDYVVNGWNVTGDTYRRDADGYYWYLARSDDMIVSSGYNIGAPEVENALLVAPRGRRMRGDRRALRRARAEGEGVRGAGGGCASLGRAGRGAAGACEGADRPLQISARDRVRRRAARRPRRASSGGVS